MTSKASKHVASDLNDEQMVDYLVDSIQNFKKQGTLVIALISGAGAGSSTLAQELINKLPKSDAIGTDDYLIGDRKYRRENIEGQDPLLKYDIEFMRQEVKKICSLRNGDEILVPRYDEPTGLALAQEPYSHKIKSLKYLIIEGDFQFLDQVDYLIYLDVPDEVRLRNRLEREIKKRNEKSKQAVKDNFEIRQKLQHVPYCEPLKDKADILVQVQADPKSGGGFIYSYSIYLK